MSIDDEDEQKEMDEISKSILDLSELLKVYEFPPPIHSAIADIMNHVSKLLFDICKDNTDKNNQIIEYRNLLSDLNYYYDELEKENKELKKFIDAVKDFPNFQC